MIDLHDHAHFVVKGLQSDANLGLTTNDNNFPGKSQKEVEIPHVNGK